MVTELVLSIDNGEKQFDVTKILKLNLKSSLTNPVDTFNAQVLNVPLAGGMLKDHLLMGSTIQIRATYTPDTLETLSRDHVTAILFTGWVDSVKWDGSQALTIKGRDSFAVVGDSCMPINTKSIPPGTHIGTIFESYLKPFGLGFEFNVSDNVKKRLKVSSGYRSTIDATGNITKTFAPNQGDILLDQNDFKIERDETVGAILQLIAKRTPLAANSDGSIPSLFIKGAPDKLAIQLLYPNYANSLDSKAEYFQVKNSKGNSAILDVEYDFDMCNQPSHFVFEGKYGGKEFKTVPHIVTAVNPLFSQAEKNGSKVSFKNSTFSKAGQDAILADLNHKDLIKAKLLPDPPKILKGNVKNFFKAGKFPVRLVVEKDEESRTLDALTAHAYRRRGNFLNEALSVSITARGWTYPNRSGDPVFYTINNVIEWSDSVNNFNSDLWICDRDFVFDGASFKTNLTCYLPYST